MVVVREREKEKEIIAVVRMVKDVEWMVVMMVKDVEWMVVVMMKNVEWMVVVVAGLIMNAPVINLIFN
jgi:hypothetical protein